MAGKISWLLAFALLVLSVLCLHKAGAWVPPSPVEGNFAYENPYNGPRFNVSHASLNTKIEGGQVIIFCTHKDSKGKVWTEY